MRFARRRVLTLREASATPSTAGDAVSGTVKIVLYVIPSTLAIQFLPHGHHVMFGLSFIAGALLQALIPPRKHRFWWILGISTIAAVVLPILNYLKGW
jgi:hypothetical protein